MICTEVTDMRVYEFAKKVIAPVEAAIFLAVLFYPLCVENGVCDYLKLWVLMGIPFGVHRMFVWIIPKEFDFGGSVGVLVINLLVGGVIGSIITAWRLIVAAVYMAQYIGTGIFWLFKKVMVRDTT